MLQQTSVAAVEGYFRRFVRKWPRLKELAAADLDEVLAMWAGLGYYRRARGLHACAKILVEEYRGVFPASEVELRKLPGFGPYTAAAVAAIAFDQKANVVDGNVERVVARLFAVQTPLPTAKKDLKALAATLLPESRFGDYAQALMDLGATVCVPRNPKCSLCPWQGVCQGRKNGIASELPRREEAKPKPLRRAFIFVAFDPRGRVFLQKRPTQGLLGGMLEAPSTPWTEKKALSWAKAKGLAPFKASWRLLSGGVHHTFTHFDLELSVACAVLSPSERREGFWLAEKELDKAALPSVMHKVLRYARAQRERETAQ